MAQALSDVEAQAQVDRLLNVLENAWGGVIEYAREWSDLDDDSRLFFVLDWPVTESHHEILQGILQDHALTPVQQQRYIHLVALIEQLRPTLDLLLAGESLSSTST